MREGVEDTRGPATAEQVREVYAKLAAKFPSNVLKTRAAGGGRTLTYITERVAMNRFDEVVGPENWGYKLEVFAVPHLDIPGVACTLWVRIPGTSTIITRVGHGGYRIMREGRGENAPIDIENTLKTGKSDAVKIAASAHGVARYLYNDGSADFSGDEGDEGEPAPVRTSAPRQEPKPASNGAPRATGAAVVDFLKRTLADHGIDLLPVAKGLASTNGWPLRPSEWTPEQAEAARQPLKDRLKEILAELKPATPPAAEPPKADPEAKGADCPFDQAPAETASTGARDAGLFDLRTQARNLMAEVCVLLWGQPTKPNKKTGGKMNDNAAFKVNYEKTCRIARECLPEAMQDYRMIETAGRAPLVALILLLTDMRDRLKADDTVFDGLKKLVA